jgi:hypothetical protein
MEWRLQISKPQSTLHMHDWLGTIPEEAKQAFLNPQWQLASNAHELEEVTSLIQTYTPWTGHEANAYKVSNTSLNVQHESWRR